MGVCCAEDKAAVTASTTTARPTTTTQKATQATTQKPKPKPTAKPRSGCGENGEYFNTRIVGGKPADKGEWPWMAALLRGGDDQYCGGVLITNQHILTAAHCVDK